MVLSGLANRTPRQRLHGIIKATQSIVVDAGQQCSFSATVAGGAMLGKFASELLLISGPCSPLVLHLGIKVIYKPGSSAIAHLLCKHAAATNVTGLFEPSEAGELILEFDNTKVWT